MWEFGKSSTSVSWRWEIPAVQLKFDTVWIRRSGGTISFCRRGNNMVYIFHVDANSAFLSWSASYRVNILEDRTDLRNVASIVGGDLEPYIYTPAAKGYGNSLTARQDVVT